MFVVIMTHSHCESSPGSRDEYRTAPDGCRPLDQANGLHPPSPFIITQPESYDQHVGCIKFAIFFTLSGAM